MPNVPISDLNPVTGLNGSEWIPIDVYYPLLGTYSTMRTQVAQIIALAAGTQGIPWAVSVGGTGQVSFPVNSVLIGQGANAIIGIPEGTTGQFLVAQTNGPPQWSNFSPGLAVTSFSGGGSGFLPATPTQGDVQLAGTLNITYGGTGSTSFVPHGLVYGGNTALGSTAEGQTGQILVGEAGLAPAWLPAGTSGYFLQSNGAGSDPSWAAISLASVVTISFGATGLTPNTATGGNVVVSGTLTTAHGGTNLATFGSANQAIYSTSASVLTAGTLPTAAGGTGSTTATGTGQNVLATGPTLVAPVLGAATLSSVNGGALAGLRNRIINGGIRSDQLHAGGSQTFTAGAALAYSVDQFYAYCTGANVTGQQVAGTGSSVSPSLFAYQFTGAAGVTSINFAQRIEQDNCFDLAGSTATLSVNLRNSVLGTVSWQVYYANTANTFGSIASPTVTSIASGVFSVTSVSANYSAQISIPSAATTGLQVVFSVGAQTSGTWVIGNVQLEAGSQATPFERIPFTTLLLACQRYAATSYDGGVVPGQVSGAGEVQYQSPSSGTSGIVGYVKLPVTMLSDPTVTLFSPTTGASGNVRLSSGADGTASIQAVGQSGFTGGYNGAVSINWMTFHYFATARL